jgi:hypothetical protein
VSGSLDNLFGPGPLARPYQLKSYVDGVPDGAYPNTDVYDTETMNARIWNGFHFRTAMTDGNALGHAVANVVAATFHPPTEQARRPTRPTGGHTTQAGARTDLGGRPRTPPCRAKAARAAPATPLDNRR